MASTSWLLGELFWRSGGYLLIYSPVFRNMLGSSTSGANGEVEFTDEKLECATTIRALLDYICKPFGDFDSLPCDTRFSLIRVAEKYDCSVLLQAITLHTEHSVGCKTHLWERFFYACALDNIEVAHRLLPAAAGFTWSSGLAEDIASVNQNITGASVLDITSMSSAWMDYLPRKYLLALIRASRLRVPSNLESWSAVADEFKKQVNLQSEYVMLERDVLS